MCLYETLYLCLSFKHIKFRIMSMCWATLSIHRHCSSMNRHGMLVHPRDQYPLKYHSDKHDERQCEETKSQYRLEVILVKNKESVQHSEDKRGSSKSCACFLPTLLFFTEIGDVTVYTSKANIKNFKQPNLSSFRMAMTPLLPFLK